MDWEAVEELKEAIGEIEEEIGIEVFITVVKKETASCEKIVEKIKRCEKLRDEYTAKVAELELEMGEKDTKYEKARISLIEEIEMLRDMRRE